MNKNSYSFEAFLGESGLSVSRAETPKTVKPQALKKLRRAVWRNYRLFLGVNTKGWWSLSRRLQDKGVNHRNRLIVDTNMTLAPTLWAADDTAKRKGLGVYKIAA